MKNVLAIINHHGGLNEFPALRIENPPYMVLCIERVGSGPRGLPLISVAHFGEQNGDQMSDPEIEFEVSPDGKFCPVSITQHYVGSYRVAVWRDEEDQVLIRPRMAADIAAFSRIWDRNLKEQGFLEAAKAPTVRCA